MLAQCLVIVLDADPSLTQHWVNVLCFLFNDFPSHFNASSSTFHVSLSPFIAYSLSFSASLSPFMVILVDLTIWLLSVAFQQFSVPHHDSPSFFNTHLSPFHFSVAAFKVHLSFFILPSSPINGSSSALNSIPLTNLYLLTKCCRCSMPLSHRKYSSPSLILSCFPVTFTVSL